MEFVGDSIREDLGRNELLQLALVKLVEIIGEATNGTSHNC